jgi:phage/plasmid primase-like uncharacterized protein
MSTARPQDERIERARAVSIEAEIARHGHELKRRGRELVGPCPKCGGHDRFSVHVVKQVWNCRGCKPAGIAGDIIGMVMWLDTCDFAAAIETLTGEARPPARPIDVVVRRQQADDDEAKQHRKAAWLWSRRQPIVGTIAETYLREARSIACLLPATLAYLPPSKVDHHPALIAAFALPDEPESGLLGEPLGVNAVHLTLLKPDGRKAEIERPKLMIGRSIGLPIVIAPPNDLLGLAICEGIEDALTAHQATRLGAWAAGSAGRMPALAAAIPSYIETVTVFAHADRAGQDGANGLAAALCRRGIETFVEGLGS